MSTMVEVGAATRARTRTLSSKQPALEKWSNDGTEQQVAKLMEEDIDPMKNNKVSSQVKQRRLQRT